MAWNLSEMSLGLLFKLKENLTFLHYNFLNLFINYNFFILEK